MADRGIKVAVIYEQLLAYAQEQGMSVEDALAHVARLGVEGVQVDGDAIEDAQVLATQISRAGLSVAALSSTYGWQSDPEDGHGAAQVQLAKVLGAKYLVPDVGRYSAEDAEVREQEYQNMQNGLFELVWLAGRSALTCVVANSGDAACPTADGPSLVRLLNDSYILRAAFHTANPLRVQGDTMRLLRAVTPRLELVYLQDIREGAVCALGEGDVALDEILSAIEASGYSGWYFLDLEGVEDYDAALKSSLNWLSSRD